MMKLPRPHLRRHAQRLVLLGFLLGILPSPQALAEGAGDGQVLLAQNAKKKSKAKRRWAKRRAAKKRAAMEREAAEQVETGGETESESRARADASSDAGDAEPGVAMESELADGAAAEAAGSAEPQASGSLRRSSHMEFDARLVRGQTAGTGAVVLFDRGQRELPPLTKTRTRFLDATVQEVYGELSAER